MSYNFPYLKDSKFLKEFDLVKLKEQFIKIIVLNYDEVPIEEIQGRVTSGNITLDGSSAMRRIANITLTVSEYENEFSHVQELLSINKKIDILIGFTNVTNEYTDEPIIWFPQGRYLIISPNILYDTNGISISLVLHDKMALLNGECGGTLPASVTFSEIEDINENGEIQVTHPTIYQIIQELVNHFGGEQLGKIIISDINNKIKKVMKWTGITPLYLYQEVTPEGSVYNSFSTNYQEMIDKQTQGGGDIKTFNYGEDIGYILTDFIYPGELVGNAGDSVVTILDQIKNILGNYEYFYDINGNFVFQEIKNYLNTSYSTFLINEMNMDNYLIDYTGGKSVYTFEDSNVVQSFSNAPQYQQIKNDFVVWGKRKDLDGKEIPIRYHLAIDQKPETGITHEVFFFTDPDDGITKAKKPVQFNSVNDFPKEGQVGVYYYAKNNGLIYKWSTKMKTYEVTDYTLESITTTDYRSELYLNGVDSEPFGLSSNYYYAELKNEWTKIYNLQGETPGFKEEAIKQPDSIDFFLDFIDTPAAISEFSVNNIGRRTVTIVDDSVNCLFESDNPNIVLIEAESADADEIREECEAMNQEYSQVKKEVYSMLVGGGSLKAAYDVIRQQLYLYTNYNEQVSLTTLPIYYLEPNTRITIRNIESNLYGDYIIKSISLPLDSSSSMTISCTKALERF